MDLSKLKEKKNVSISAPKGEMLPLDLADEELLRDDNDEPVAVTLAFKKDGIKRKEQPDDQSVSWFVKTQYISPINTKATKQPIGKRRVKMRERLGARNILENLYDRESKRKETEASFEACRSLPAHATNKELQPVEVLPLLPDFDRFRNDLPDITRDCNILLLKRDPERFILAEQRAFLTAQELAKVVGIKLAEASQVEPIRTAPISICIRDPETLEVLQLDKENTEKPLLLEMELYSVESSGKVNCEQETTNRNPSFQNLESIAINDGELSVDLYSSNWETELEEEEMKKRRLTKKWKGIVLSNEEKKVKVHRYHTRSKNKFNQSDDYYDPYDYGSC